MLGKTPNSQRCEIAYSWSTEPEDLNLDNLLLPALEAKPGKPSAIHTDRWSKLHRKMERRASTEDEPPADTKEPDGPLALTQRYTITPFFRLPPLSRLANAAPGTNRSSATVWKALSRALGGVPSAPKGAVPQRSTQSWRQRWLANGQGRTPRSLATAFTPVPPEEHSIARVVARSGLLNVFKAAAARADGRDDGQDTAVEEARPQTPAEAEMEASAVAAENIQLCFLAAIERAQSLS
jgi:hypothetical protein